MRRASEHVLFERLLQSAVRSNGAGIASFFALFVVAFVGLWLWRAATPTHEPKPEPQPTPILGIGQRTDRPLVGPPTETPEIHLALGNPSGATADATDRENYLLSKPYYALSYNEPKGIPNWVSWCLRWRDLGRAPRKDFYPDKSLPRSFYQVTPRDYSSSGFDRGHMCPHGDRAATPEASASTFAMTNIIPQSPECNQKAWAQLENYCRTLADVQQRTLYIVCGPHGQGGEGKAGRRDTLAEGKVVVPASCWKVILAVENGEGGAIDIPRVGPTTRPIAVVMPNDRSVGEDWGKFRTSIRQVEQLTGYRFFDKVPAERLDPLKAKVDDERIVVTPRRGGWVE
jgi:endonuclease G